MKDKEPQEKLKWELIGTDNNGFRHRYSIRKDETFKDNFIDFMIGLDFNRELIERRFFYEDSEEITREVNVIELLDLCWHFENSFFDVDVFFGSSKIILVIRTKERKKLIEILMSRSDFVEPLTYESVEEVSGTEVVQNQLVL